MWNPSTSKFNRKRDDLIQESRDIAVDMAKLDNEIYSDNPASRDKTLKEMVDERKLLDEKSKNYIKYLGEVVSYSTPLSQTPTSLGELEGREPIDLQVNKENM